MSRSLVESWEYFRNVRWRNMPWNFKVTRKAGFAGSGGIVAMIRLRNEDLILQDTLNHLGRFADAIVVFDDASTDRSVEIAKQHPAVACVIENRRWNHRNRPWEETSNRSKLLEMAESMNPDWYFYADADERFDGDVRAILMSQPAEINAVKMNLFDAYLSEGDSEPYERGTSLLNSRRKFGPERRQILVAWRGSCRARYRRVDTRAPEGVGGPFADNIHCQHYGKGISTEQWEATCDYYIAHFPEYAEKWRLRKGKAIHTTSDFGTPLYEWGEVAKHAIDIQ